MVERSLSMREAPGSMPGFSTFGSFEDQLRSVRSTLVRSQKVASVVGLEFKRRFCTCTSGRLV